MLGIVLDHARQEQFGEPTARWPKRMKLEFCTISSRRLLCRLHASESCAVLNAAAWGARGRAMH
eukprot:1983663-Pyramimonas_sp.AAC.1